MSKAIFCLVLAICSGIVLAQQPARFETDVSPGPRPWLNENFDTGDDRFTFAIFSDLQSGERPRVFDVAVAQLSLLRPELIINVGDLIPGPSDDPAELHGLWDSFDERAARARAPVFYVGGNHDLGEETIRGATSQQVWSERYGPTYYSFVYKDVLFLVLNTQDGAPSAERVEELRQLGQETGRMMREGADITDTPFYATRFFRAGYISDEQRSYFLDAIARNTDVRWTFLFMHKAPWEEGGDENFFEIEEALTDRPYTVFHGHEHSYEHLERRGRDYIRLATTGGGQEPSFRVSPVTGDARGRAMDQVALVTVDGSSIEIANLVLSGIRDKTGRIPLDGDEVCFELSVCDSGD